MHLSNMPSVTVLLLATTYVQSSFAEDVVSTYSTETYFRDTIVNTTDVYRIQHNASRIEWNETLAEFAQDWVDACEFKHSVRAFLVQVHIWVDVGLDANNGDDDRAAHMARILAPGMTAQRPR
jgi:hypothetical protein